MATAAEKEKMSGSLRDRLIKNSTIKETDVLEDSKFFDDEPFIDIGVPAINVALSGQLDGGLESGLVQLAGPSKHFKSGLLLLLMKAYMDEYPDAMCLFYDNEFGAPKPYFKAFNIDMSRVIHTPLMNLEEFKFDIMNQLDNIKRGDKLFIAVDSIGNIASKKEVDDALEKNDAADMTRAKVIKSCFRMITPHLSVKRIPMVIINHTYQTQEKYSKTVVSGGCLVEGTLLKMADGQLKCIESIVPGEYVLTLDGPKEVTHSWNPETLEDGTPECYEIEFDDGYKVICSDEHKFLIDNKWIEAKNLKIGAECEIL